MQYLVHWLSYGQEDEWLTGSELANNAVLNEWLAGNGWGFTFPFFIPLPLVAFPYGFFDAPREQFLPSLLTSSFWLNGWRWIFQRGEECKPGLTHLLTTVDILTSIDTELRYLIKTHLKDTLDTSFFPTSTLVTVTPCISNYRPSYIFQSYFCSWSILSVALL